MQINNAAVVAIVAVGLVMAPSISRSAIVETIIDMDTDTAVGSITFPSLIGSSAAGVEFPLEGFTQTDITSISWTLDSSTYAVDALNLNARTGDAVCNGEMNCSFQVLSLSESGFSRGGGSCSFDPASMTGTCEEFFTFPTPVSFVLTSPVPEPSTWAMMLVGFAGLEFAGYRASRKAAA